MEPEKAIVLLSGGMDSALALALTCQQCPSVYAISFDYGQRHRCELDFASRLAAQFKVLEHRVVQVDLSQWGGSALTDETLDVGKSTECSWQGDQIPNTYVPARNTVFLSVALSYAEAVGADTIVVGFNADDYSNYPDCRPEYLKAFGRLSQLATREGLDGHGVTISAPLIDKSKLDIVRLMAELGIDPNDTWTCYAPTREQTPCGQCDACYFRESAWQALAAE